MHLCIFIGERSRSFEKAFLVSGLVLLIPAGAYRMGIDALSLFTPLSFPADGNLLLSGSFPVFTLWAVLSVAALIEAKRRWCRPE